MAHAELNRRVLLASRKFGLTGALGFSLLALLSVALKVWIAGWGHSYDTAAMEKVGAIMASGGNPYSQPADYNYGPIWMYVLGFVHMIEKTGLVPEPESFHRILALILSLVDCFLAWLLFLRGKKFAAVLFLLNPALMAVTGFQSQFNEVPLAVALVALLPPNRKPGMVRYCSFMGLSLITKHIMLFFPLIALPYFLKRWKKEKVSPLLMIAVLVLPGVLFLLSFLPWLIEPAARQGIVEKVFLYSANPFAGFFPRTLASVLPLSLVESLQSSFLYRGVWFGLWVGAILAFGIFFRGRSLIGIFLVYLMVFVSFSPALWSSYLTIPFLAAAIYWRSLWMQLFLLACTVHYWMLATPTVGRIFPWRFNLEEIFGGAFPHHWPLIFILIFLWERTARKGRWRQLRGHEAKS